MTAKEDCAVNLGPFISVNFKLLPVVYIAIIILIDTKWINQPTNSQKLIVLSSYWMCNCFTLIYFMILSLYDKTVSIFTLVFTWSYTTVQYESLISISTPANLCDIWNVYSAMFCIAIGISAMYTREITDSGIVINVMYTRVSTVT